MKPATSANKFRSGVPPWIFIGAVAVLFPIFAFMTFQNISRQREHSTRLLVEKGAALIRSFEAGTRSGMLGMHGSGFKLQNLLSETAQQPDIEYLLVTDAGGRILAHDDPARIGAVHGRDLDLAAVARSREIHWRSVTTPDQRKIFEVYRRFAPTAGPRGSMRGHRMMLHRWLQPDQGGGGPEPQPPGDWVIFVGMDMVAIEDAVRSDTRHAVVMGAVLLLIGLAGVSLLLLAQNYRAARTSLSRIKAFSDTLVANMPIGLMAIDTHKKIASLNPVAASVLGLPAAQTAGRTAQTALPPALWQLADQVGPGDEGIEKEVDCPLPNGQTLPLEVSVTRLQDEGGTHLGAMLLFKDLREVRELQREIARNQRLASVGKLAAGVAHEIRNPLSSIKGFATYFKERYRQVPEDQDIADIMIQEVDRLDRVVGQLLDFAKPVTVARRAVDVRALVTDSLRLIAKQAAERGLRIASRLPDQPCPVVLDPDRISQVLLNLYLNAIEAMDAGGVLTVTAERRDATGTLVLEVSDTGRGIPEADMTHIFDPYFTTKASGTGIGLAIVHNIVEAHDGHIQVESRPDRGTVFRILLDRKGDGQSDEN